MLDKVFSLKSTIDIFVTETENPDKVLLTFHKMTTRSRIELITGRSVAEFLAILDGKKNTYSILKELGNFDEKEALSLITFLQEQHLIIDACENKEVPPRFSRQIAYFDDMILDRSGLDTQTKLESKKVVILGCGSIGAAIAEILVRAGVSKLSLVDYKVITESSMDRHLFTRLDHIGLAKVEVLADYLRSINSSLKVKTYQEHLLPNTDLSKWIPDDTDLIINSCDEPYIGHIALKVGRYSQIKNIPLYIAGGFDAHLMSSGELIYPPYTPCIDCAQQTFTKALGNWKPTYSDTARAENIIEQQENIHLVSEISPSYQIGGAGGLVMMSSFSANFSCLKILQFLAEDSAYDYKAVRYEYLPNDGELTSFEMKKQEYCNVCNN